MTYHVMRYYAQCTEVNPEFRVGWSTAWQVFDRHVTTPQGACIAIALCRSRAVAFSIRDALNKVEDKLRQEV